MGAGPRSWGRASRMTELGSGRVVRKPVRDQACRPADCTQDKASDELLGIGWSGRGRAYTCRQVHTAFWCSWLWLADEGVGFAVGPPRPPWEQRLDPAGSVQEPPGWRLPQLGPHLFVLALPGGPPGESVSYSGIKVGSLDKADFAIGSRVSLQSAESTWASLARDLWPELHPASISDLVWDSRQGQTLSGPQLAYGLDGGAESYAPRGYQCTSHLVQGRPLSQPR